MSAVRTDWGHATEFDDIRGQVAICGVGESDHSKASGRSAEDIAAEAIARAIEDAGLEPADIDGIMFPGGMAEAFDASAFRRRFGGDGEMFESGRGGAMVWAATAPAVAARALADGRARYIVNAFSVAWASQRGQMTGGPGQFHAGDPFKSNLEAPFGWFPQPVYFATIARRHMHEFGTTEEQLGSIAVTCRRHANLTPSAVMHDKTLTLEDYLARPMLADPLRVEDCCLISDGGAAYIMTTPERAGDLRQKAVTVEGIGEGVSGSGLYWAQQPAFTSTPQVFAAPAAYRMAGIGPDDVDVLALYDPFTIVALMQIEDMGFCDKGDGGAFAVSGALDFDSGRLPYNTHGGLLSHAYVLGNAHVVELVRQLRGQAEAQAGGPELAVYGGYTGHLAATMVLRGA